LYDELLQRVLPLICDLSVGSGDWSPLLSAISRGLRGSAVGLLSHDFMRNQGFIHPASTFNHEYINSYRLDYARQNVWLARERCYMTPGRVLTDEELVPGAELIRSKFYKEWLKPQDLHHRICAVLLREQRTVVLLEVLRPRDAAAFDRNDVEGLRLLLPHLQRALRIQRRLAELEIERDAAIHALDHLPWGVVLIDDRGNRLAANRRAQEILVAGDGLVTQGAALRPVFADEAIRLSRLLDNALRPQPASRNANVGGTLAITRPSGAHPLSVQVFPLGTKTEPLGDRVSAAAIFVSDPELPANSNEQHLRDLYALTAVEARLAARLAHGESVDTAAAEMGLSVNTARAYVKRIYHKTGVRRQSELVRLVLVGLTQLRQAGGGDRKADRASDKPG